LRAEHRVDLRYGGDVDAAGRGLGDTRERDLDKEERAQWLREAGDHVIMLGEVEPV